MFIWFYCKTYILSSSSDTVHKCKRIFTCASALFLIGNTPHSRVRACTRSQSLSGSARITRDSRGEARLSVDGSQDEGEGESAAVSQARTLFAQGLISAEELEAVVQKDQVHFFPVCLFSFYGHGMKFLHFPSVGTNLYLQGINQLTRENYREIIHASPPPPRPTPFRAWSGGNLTCSVPALWVYEVNG